VNSATISDSASARQAKEYIAMRIGSSSMTIQTLALGRRIDSPPIRM